MKLVQIYKDGKMEDIEIKATSRTLENKLIKRAVVRGGCKIKELYTWKYDTKIISCYGWIEGDEGNINIHNLIADGYSRYLDQDSSEIKLYGDVFICCKEGVKFKDLDILEYGEFYTNNNIYNEYESDSSDYEEDEVVSEEVNYIKNLKKKNVKTVNAIKKLKRDTNEYL
jgi:hypothetical protein